MHIINQKKGYFVVIEGIDGSGKTTQVNYLTKSLDINGYLTTQVQSPGSCSISRKIRDIVKDPKLQPTKETELLLMNAAQAQTAAELIKPALNEGSIVIADRYHFSTLAYQGARDIDYEIIKAVIQFSLKDVMPDLTILLQLSETEADKRRKARNSTNDRFETDQAYLSKVNANYDNMAKLGHKSNGKMVVVAADKPKEDIHNEIYRIVLNRLLQMEPGQVSLKSKIII